MIKYLSSYKTACRLRELLLQQVLSSLRYYRQTRANLQTRSACNRLDNVRTIRFPGADRQRRGRIAARRSLVLPIATQ